jgi:hypothetical protein
MFYCTGMENSFMRLALPAAAFLLSTVASAAEPDYRCEVKFTETAPVRAELSVDGRIVETKVILPGVEGAFGSRATWQERPSRIETTVYVVRTAERPVGQHELSADQQVSGSVPTHRFGPVAYTIAQRGNEIVLELAGDRVDQGLRILLQDRSAQGVKARHIFSQSVELRDDPFHVFEYQGQTMRTNVGLGTVIKLECVAGYRF